MASTASRLSDPKNPEPPAQGATIASLLEPWSGKDSSESPGLFAIDPFAKLHWPTDECPTQVHVRSIAISGSRSRILRVSCTVAGSGGPADHTGGRNRRPFASAMPVFVNDTALTVGWAYLV
jgi:hypothetical protein